MKVKLSRQKVSPCIIHLHPKYSCDKELYIPNQKKEKIYFCVGVTLFDYSYSTSAHLFSFTLLP
uniref:Uncharacterized protein n=1 Tax=Phasianus colchicus TaxID=9054 RepID=A0A669QNP5_PHACC